MRSDESGDRTARAADDPSGGASRGDDGEAPPVSASTMAWARFMAPLRTDHSSAIPTVTLVKAASTCATAASSETESVSAVASAA